jgi:hypothetical protein
MVVPACAAAGFFEAGRPSDHPGPGRPSPYIRPYGDLAPWNVPATNLPTSPDSGALAAQLWSQSTANRPGNLNLTFDEYTFPVYYVGDATGVYPIEIRSGSPLDGGSMPWNPEWVPATGSDGQIIVLDPATGREWNLWQVSFDGETIHASNGNLVPGSYWTKVDGFFPSRGAGIQYYAMLVQPEEIEGGAIRHALSMPIKNTDGTTYVPPATKLEHPDNSSGIPAGTRFVLDLSDKDIDAWIKAMPPELSPATRQSARVIAEALRTYGFFVTDTSGGAHLQFEDYATASDQWHRLGLDRQLIDGKEYPRDLLDGLFDQTSIRAIVPSDQYLTLQMPPSDR